MRYSSKINSILENGKKCREKIGNVGPTGPRGEMGPTGPSGSSTGDTIVVNSTKTLAPGSDARVVDNHQGTNHILDFEIPRGDVGPQGLADTISIRSTITSAPGSDAKVTDTQVDNVHFLDFEIPRGETGPTGPDPRSVYAHKFSDLGDPIALNINIFSVVPLNRDGQSSNINIDNENEFVILETGIYRIEYYFSGHISDETALSLQLENNGDFIDGSEISKDVLANVDNDFYGFTIVRLVPNDVISLNIKANKNTTLTPAPDTNAYVFIARIA